MFAVSKVPKDLLLTLFPWERILFITVISISCDKTRVEKELSHFYLFLLKNSVEIVLSDCSQDYTHDQLRSDQQ